MSPVSLGLNLLLAMLLGLTLALGWRLNKRLKALRDGQEGFARAVADLDRAAGRAERGLADLRAATDEAVEFLSGRIDKGRELAAKLERLTASAAASLDAAPPSRIAAMEQLWAKPANQSAPAPIDDHEAAAESLVLKLSEVFDRQPAASVAPAAANVQTFAPRSRAMVDDDLFETAPRASAFDAAPRAAARAFAGGR
jgi:hypothetical protein